MKAKVIIGLLVLSWVLAGSLVYLHKGRVQLIKLPPESLAQWYKPQSERHIWLHNMFNLRREMQAVAYYAKSGDPAALADWMTNLQAHYQKIAEMVPEWKGQLDFKTLDVLRDAQQANEFDAIGPNIDRLQQSCDACHEQYRAVSAALYRAPDFKDLSISPNRSLSESMVALNEQVNHIKIAVQAQDTDRAMEAFLELKHGMRDVGGLCVSCHEHIPKEYPDATITAALDDLEAQLVSGAPKLQSRALGMLAVTACAQCHGTHRIAYDMRKLLGEKPGLLELLKH